MDNKYAELERVQTKIEFMLDANSNARAEARLGNLVT